MLLLLLLVVLHQRGASVALCLQWSLLLRLQHLGRSILLLLLHRALTLRWQHLWRPLLLLLLLQHRLRRPLLHPAHLVWPLPHGTLGLPK